ncbi:MAG: hypothetical protein KBC64_01215 [Simkaniaceae bacterium]|nr:hypothetical protein [Simkaniaceae bacterium]
MKYLVSLMVIFFPMEMNAFILEARQIHLPKYPDAFNPSIVRWKGKLLMSFRNIADPKNSYHSSEIGLVWLDDSFHPEGIPQIILGPHRAEDARLIEIGDRLYMIYSDNEDSVISKGGFRVYVAELKEKNGIFSIFKKERLVKFEGENPSLREKNWTPFEHQDNLLLSYSLDPHLVFRPLLGAGECETVACSSKSLPWNWGELRGGTQLLQVGGSYLTFFHSSVRMKSEASEGKEMLHYFMGASLFQSKWPFEMTHISPEPIVDESFFAGPIYKPYWGSWRGVFPGGFVFDDNFIWIVYGKQNHELWVVKLHKEKLLESLTPVFLNSSSD